MFCLQVEVSYVFFPHRLHRCSQMFSRTDSDCTIFWSLDGSCHAGCFAHQSSSLAVTIIRVIRKICVRKTHDKTEHLCPSVQSMGRNSCYSYCFPPYPPIQFTVSCLSEKQCILSRKPAIFHHRRGDGDVYCMVNAPCLVWSMRKVPNDDGGGYGCGME